MQDGPRIIPPGGWHYPEHGETAPPIKAGSLEELVDAITTDRIANKREIGDPLYDVRNFVIKNHPHMEGAVAVSRPEIAQRPGGNNLRERVTIWASKVYHRRMGGNSPLASQEEAEARAETCETCPHNQKINQDCAPCVREMSRDLFNIRQGHNISRPDKVHGCDILGHDNNTAAFVTSLLPSQKERLGDTPEFCWARGMQ